MNWKDPAIAARLKELWDAGHSCSTIARMIGDGVTRNAVIGAVSRAKLPRRASTTNHNIRSKKRRPQRRLPPSATTRVDTVRALFKADGYVPPAEEVVIPDNERKYINTLEETDCRWPIGDPRQPDFHFCGKNKIPGLPYCEIHARRAFLPPKPRTPPGVSAPAPVVVRKELEAA